MITLKNAFLQVQVNPFGAELTSVLYQGKERLWQGDPAVWAGRAPVLFPVAGAFLNGRYAYQGKTYEMPQHGFARRREFQLLSQEEDSVSLLLSGREENYPFDYRFIVSFALLQDAPAIKVTYKVENPGDAPLYYTLGAHEAYACPEGIEAYEVVFPDDTMLHHSVLQGSQLTHETLDYPLNEHSLSLCSKMFVPDALVFAALQSRSVLLKSPLTPNTVRVDFDDFPTLLLWQKPGAKYLCIEPWLNAPEFVDHDGELTHKPGIQQLASQEERSYVHTITFG